MDKKYYNKSSFNRYFEYIATAPSMIFIIVIVVFPTIYLFWESVRVHNILHMQNEFNGFANFITMFTDNDFLRYFSHTAIFTMGTMVIAFFVSLGLAVTLNRELKFKSLFIAIILLPWTIPPVSTAVLWGWLFNLQYGVVNIILAKLGFEKIYFFGNTVTAMIILIFADAWVRIPLTVLLLYAGLQRVPQNIIDAARIDGANAWQTFWKVTVGFIRPEISMALIILIMFGWREFSLPYTLTGGGPEDFTEIFGITLYKQANLYLRYGKAASIGVFILILTIFLAYFVFKIRKTEV